MRGLASRPRSHECPGNRRFPARDFASASLDRTQEVGGSSPPSSTENPSKRWGSRVWGPDERLGVLPLERRNQGRSGKTPVIRAHLVDARAAKHRSAQARAARKAQAQRRDGPKRGREADPNRRVERSARGRLRTPQRDPDRLRRWQDRKYLPHCSGAELTAGDRGHAPRDNRRRCRGKTSMSCAK